MPAIVVLMGPQGAGKGTQAQRVSERLTLPIVATGDILREVARGDTEIGRQVKSIQAAGQLVSDDILAEVIHRRTSESDCTSGYILDGFPRTLPQARLLDSIARTQGHEIVVVSIKVPRELLYKRLTGRRTCTGCGAIYNIYSQPSVQENACDLCGKPLVMRPDDNEDAIAKRLALYDEKTQPIMNYYRESGRLHVVDGTGTPKAVFSRVISVL
ncbi:MAG TPA: adenylate kinase [Blastocatellia bacterium]|nr:adenylate kinase [Blastocatellia bacterium]